MWESLHKKRREGNWELRKGVNKTEIAGGHHGSPEVPRGACHLSEDSPSVPCAHSTQHHTGTLQGAYSLQSGSALTASQNYKAQEGAVCEGGRLLSGNGALYPLLRKDPQGS